MPSFSKSLTVALFIPLMLLSIGSSLYGVFGPSPKVQALASDYGVSFASNRPVLDPSDIEVRWIHASRIEVTFLAAPDNKIIFIPAAPLGDNLISNKFHDRLGNDEGKVLFKAPGYNDCGDEGASIYFDFKEDGGYYQNLNSEFASADTIAFQFLQSASADCQSIGLSDVALLDPAKSNDWFVWVSPTQIQTVDGLSMGQFTQDTTNPLYFVRDSEASSDCKDKLLLDTASNTVRLFELAQDFGGNNNGTDPPPEANAGSGCEMRENGGIPTSNVPWGVSGTATEPAAGTFPTEGGVADDGGCEVLGGAFSFVLCPLLKISDEGFKWLDARIVSALNVNSAYYDNEGVRGAWANLRNIAYILLIPILLVMVIGTALGFSFVDAYTVKRALPRLLVAIIFIALSFDIARLLIELSNVVGKGTAGLLASPFGGVDNLSLDNLFLQGQGNGNAAVDGIVSVGSSAAFASGAIVAGVIASATTGFGIWALAITIGLAVLSMIVVFAILTLREMLIIFLLIMAPVAILAWIFPGNDKLWKIWWQAFSKMLIFFPLIMGIIISGRAFARIIEDSGSSEGLVVTTIIKLIAFVGPYFFIPAAFKFAGGALGNLAGMVNNKSKGIFDRGKKLRGGVMKSKLESIDKGQGIDPDSILGRTELGKSINKRRKDIRDQISAVKNDGMARGLFSRKAGDARRAASIRQKDEERKHAEQDPTLIRESRNDNFDEAYIQVHEGKSDEEILKHLSKSANYSETGAIAAIAQARSMYGRYSHGALATVLMGKVGSNTSYTGGEDQLLEDIIRVGHGDEGYMMSMLGEARSTAASKGLFHLSGGSFGEDAAMLQAKLKLRAGGTMSKDISFVNETTGETETIAGTAGMDETSLNSLINTRKQEKARDGMQSWDFARIHPTAAKQLASSLHGEVQRLSSDAFQESDPNERQRKMRALGQKIAQVKSINASVSQSSSNEVKTIFADALDNASGEQATLSVGGDSYGSLNHLMSSVDQMSRSTASGDRTTGSTDYESVTGGFKSTSYSPYDGMSAAQQQAEIQRQKGGG